MSDLLVDSEESWVMVATLVWSSGPHVQGPYQSGGMAGMLEMSEVARVCWRGLVRFRNM
jgi:hypothetical protein